MRTILLLGLIASQLTLTSCIEWGRLSKVLNPDALYDPTAGDKYLKEFRGNEPFPSNYTWSKLRSVAASDSSNNLKAKQYLQSGIALSDQLCSVWFRRLGQAQAQVNADRDIISNVGALTAVIMGITAAPPVAVGAAAGATAFLENMFKTEEANFIVAPSVAKVQSAIDLQRAALAADLWGENIDFS